MSRLLWPIAGKQFSPYIHGHFVKPSSQHIRKLINPSDKSHLADVHEASPSQVEEAIISAKGVSVNSEWQTNPRYRRDCLLALAQRLEQHEHDMAGIESLQTGKPLEDALYEISDVVDCLRYYAGYCDKLYGQSQSLHKMHTYTSREPLGTVSLITSFNYPLLLVGWKLGPALAAGNAAIVKPAPQTPLSSLALADLATDILPPGVLNVLPGGVQVSQLMIDRTDKTSFTGSTKVGQEIMRRAADRLLPLTLECGGKNAVIVCDDADLDKAVDAVAMGAFSNAGQNCCAISRVFVHRSVYDIFLDKLATTVQNSWKATLDAQGENEYNLYGPLIDHNQYNRVLASIQNSNQTPFLTGNISASTSSRGYFVPPTVFCNVDDCAPLAMEEIFGPVLSVMEPFDHLDDAVRRVNQSVYGLASGVFSQNIKTAHKAANLIKAGFVWCNTYNVMPPSLPFGGRRLSGIGKDLGKSALDQFSFEKSVIVDIS
ncbi:aldehyde dehydrogenase domain-containing protein [Parasitella parasitica]|nr:aldehyde dehydrogenase domain-containing protein [Parasitella parasitica]